MRFDLVCHPDTQQSALDSIVVTVAPRKGACLRVSFRARGDVAAVRWPGAAKRGEGPWSRADELWRHSCFEVFFGLPDKLGYREVNLSTSGRWAGYRFTGYREGMADANDVALLAAKWRILSDRAEMHALIELPSAYRHADLILGLSAVIEDGDGGKSYWALAHPPGKPDFHHRDCFALPIAAPDAI
ncbi:DOMON-like domain-containing protein [Stakelama sp. CBK3Z-3]|uniref:DOMON-like domain-containing protein n=1 Tax=Stakelama flava TaxID=2860338 RepID=A0ABS6XGH0_9SPHN|nr:DOMON-like domain-containing protein [Stakelama flava]MBW4329313.1 DOMON-like domain-containing protein [Stakelama flava]